MPLSGERFRGQYLQVIFNQIIQILIGYCADLKQHPLFFLAPKDSLIFWYHIHNRTMVLICAWFSLISLFFLLATCNKFQKLTKQLYKYIFRYVIRRVSLSF